MARPDRKAMLRLLSGTADPGGINASPADALPRKRQPFTLPLSLVLASGFLLCSVLPMALVRQRGQARTEAQIITDTKAIIQRDVEQARQALSLFIKESYVLGVVSEVAARTPDLLRRDVGADLLWRALQISPYLDVVYVVFEDGSQYVVSRIDQARRRSAKQQIPIRAQWQRYWEDPVQAGRIRMRRTQYFDNARQPIGALRWQSATIDPRRLDPYQEARLKRQLAFTAVRTNPETRSQVVTFGLPIITGRMFKGFVGANITLSGFSDYARSQNHGLHSQIYLLDNQGRVAASSQRTAGLHRDQILPRILGHPDFLANGIFQLTDSRGTPLIIGTRRFAIGSSPNHWQLISITPEASVLGEQRNNAWTTAQEQLYVIGFVLLLILIFSWRITRKIELVSGGFSRVGELQLDPPIAGSLSRLREVAMLQHGLALLIESLRAFARFVPDDLVRRIAYRSEGFTEGVVEQELTIFFCDIAGFTSLAECQPLEQTLIDLRDYFNLVCQIINEEDGTVDKFIGDAVMAFWGAPEALPYHALRAARAALRIQEAIGTYNRTQADHSHSELVVRIGLHTATVLVGTIGSADRLNYTAIGDGVNIASRLEGLNKDLGTQICISDAVVQSCGEALITRNLGMQHLRGRGTDLIVHELLRLR
ncbi:MAG: adenylate/guanylate cyclase domain-containing protein [Cyanobium sp.]